MTTVPATYEHAIGNNKNDMGKSAKYIAESVQHFITLMDTLQLNRYAVDELHPILADLIQSLNKLITLHSMKASDRITEEQARQMLFEMEQLHIEFYRLLSGEHKDTIPQ
ncbi:VPS28-domain-containing protein [Rhizopus microsporus ATCC 52813]|uniref:VPS28-domain-containing protein n=1 Tax=Rhizopus microsporus ATCC 52813 TaxID=1340429 RepID=A0A2G4T2F1_RHIZD|nr:VPS28-domain-containing protein [Rhizopus microsporus ATCC 52813]PHZ15184.1 VPS28-domain-containing protein [Rhizopus microsporus ATCC 52813]